MTSLSDTLLDNLLTAVLILNEELTITYANSAAEQLFCLSQRRLKELTLSQLLPNSRINPEQIRNTLELSQGLTDNDINVDVEGYRHSVNLNLSRFEWQHKKAILLELHTTDKERKLRHDALQGAQQQAANELIRGLAHEIKNPLGGLRGAAQLLDKMLNSDELREYTQIIMSQADRLRNLVDRLLGPQKMGQRKTENIHAVLEKVRRLVEIENHHLTIIRDYDPSLPELDMDPEQLEQAILNVVNNAAYVLNSQSDAKIQLRTRTEYQTILHGERHRLAVRLDISDNGSGIADEIRQTLFYPMVSGRPDGTGLGLAITRNLIDQHKGKISVTSKKGHTQFTILLPIYPKEVS